jgi:uncharacterized repeat protein (TIGR03806 family)
MVLRFLTLVLLAFGLTGASGLARDTTPNLKAILAPAPPETLSAYALFSDAGARSPASGVTLYELNTALFSDDAAKFRYLYTPPGTRARYTSDGVLDFPVGTVLIKTFAYPADMRRPDENLRFLETRLLIRKAKGWEALPYIWNAAQTEARLSLVGAELDAHWIDATGTQRHIDWLAPNKNQCKGCHALGDAVTPIGPKARKLNRSVIRNGTTHNQLALLVERGHLDRAPADGPVLARFEDATAPIDERARAYLDVNCGHCYNPRRPASNSGLALTYETQSPFQWGVYKRPVATGRSSGELLFSIKPGAPDESILLHRMRSTEDGVIMPELGRTMAHEPAVNLIREWIAGMGQDGRQKQ